MDNLLTTQPPIKNCLSVEKEIICHLSDLNIVSKEIIIYHRYHKSIVQCLSTCRNISVSGDDTKYHGDGGAEGGAHMPHPKQRFRCHPPVDQTCLRLDQRN